VEHHRDVVPFSSVAIAIVGTLATALPAPTHPISFIVLPWRNVIKSGVSDRIFSRQYQLTWAAHMDTFEQFVEKFSNAVDFQTDVALTADTDLKALPEWDSLAALGVIIMFDMEYSKAIVGKDLVACQTVADVYKLIG
jgi:acyl carrier protein